MAKHPTKIRKAQLLKAIAGSGGIVSTIAARLDVSWSTAHAAIAVYPEAQAAYDAEMELPLDMAESVVVTNIAMAKRDQEQLKLQVDSGDAKWLLTKRGKKRGYGDAVAVENGEKPFKIVVEYVDNANTDRD
jgi:hypothetical protein